jgi:hypothetical protein
LRLVRVGLLPRILGALRSVRPVGAQLFQDGWVVR